MKKTTCILLAMVMLLSLCACGSPKTIEEACEKADRQVSKWDANNYNLYSYSSSYSSDNNLYLVVMTSQSTDPLMLTNSIVKPSVEEVYKDTEKYFSRFDIMVGVIVYDRNNNVLCAYDGEKWGG